MRRVQLAWEGGKSFSCVERWAMSDRWVAVALIVITFGLSVSGSVLAGLKGLRASSFFGVLFILIMFGLVTAEEDYVAGVGFVAALLLLGWAPVVGLLGVARPGSWWYRKRYDEGDKFMAQRKYDRFRL